jgi:flagellar basal body-associated protein FliL
MSNDNKPKQNKKTSIYFIIAGIILIIAIVTGIFWMNSKKDKEEKVIKIDKTIFSIIDNSKGNIIEQETVHISTISDLENHIDKRSTQETHQGAGRSMHTGRIGKQIDHQSH